jgi:sec-independent protein translocase protein TatA
MFGLRMPELIVILLVLVLLFGANKLPQLGQGLGEGLKMFRKAFRSAQEDEQAPAPKQEAPAQTRAGPGKQG